MRTVTFCVSDVEHAKARMAAALRGEEAGALVSFASVELLWEVMTPRRWALIQALLGREAISLHAVSRLVGRDLETVHADVHALLGAGVLERAPNGIIFPYDAVHVDFVVVGES